jgi:hypothetical protein
MEIQIPPKTTRRWTGPYNGNYEGDLWRTFNVDLENSPGHITMSRSFKNVADTGDTNLMNMAVIDAFTRTNADGLDRWWALNRAGRLARTDTLNPITLTTATWDEDTLANSPIDARDMTIHENDSNDDSGFNRLFVTRDTDIAVLNDTASNTWNRNWWVTTKSQVGLRQGVPHPIEYFALRRITVIGDGYFVHTIDKNENVIYARLTLPVYLQVEGIFTTPFRVYILCSGKQGKNGAIIEWDGSSETYNRMHDAQSAQPLAGVDYNGIPIIINNRGLVLEFDGNGFSPMMRNGQKICFPFYEELGNTFILSTSYAYAPIKPRGMTVSDDGMIYINVKEPSIASQRQLAGIWCLNPISGRLYSKYSLNMGGDTDYGQQTIVDPGAIKAINPESDPNTSSYLLAGGSVYSNYTSAQPVAIWALHRAYSSTTRRGFFITQYIPADSIQEFWDTIWLRLSAFRSANDRVIIKARGVNPLLDASRRHLEKICTWASGTTFTVTLSSSDDALAIGDEVEVIAGKNGGVLAHITTISGAHAALQTITIDETIVNTSGVSLCRFDRWKKLGVINDTSKYFVPQNIGISSSFIQFKVEIRGPATDFDIKNLVVNTKPQTYNKK